MKFDLNLNDEPAGRRAFQGEGMLQVSLGDNGPGISEAQKGKEA